MAPRVTPLSLTTLSCAAALLLSVLALLLGAADIDPGDLFQGSIDTTGWTVLAELRAPRVALGWLCGAGLALSGCACQAAFRNPLAEPGLIGVSGGAALLACAALSGLGGWAAHQTVAVYALTAAAFVGGLAAAALAWLLARDGDPLRLLLAGIAINAMAGAGIALIQVVVEPERLRLMMQWLFGSLGRAGWTEIVCSAPLLVGAAVWLLRHHRELDLLLLGEQEAALAGLDVIRFRRRLLAVAVLAAATSVALCGAVGFIGLLVPHLVRRLSGPLHRPLLPAAAGLGVALLLAADLGARTLFAPRELPVGVLTAAFGGPVFLLLMWPHRHAGR